MSTAAEIGVQATTDYACVSMRTEAPHERFALDAWTPVCFHVQRRWRRASESECYAQIS
jgi:hypothetical protein